MGNKKGNTHGNHQGNGCQPGEQAKNNEGAAEKFSKNNQRQRRRGADAERVGKSIGFGRKGLQLWQSVLNHDQRAGTQPQKK